MGIRNRRKLFLKALRHPQEDLKDIDKMISKKLYSSLNQFTDIVNDLNDVREVIPKFSEKELKKMAKDDKFMDDLKQRAVLLFRDDMINPLEGVLGKTTVSTEDKVL